MIRVACTALLKRIVAGRANKDGTALIGGGDDVTGDCLKATAELIGAGNSITLKVNGADAYVIAVKAVDGAKAVTQPAQTERALTELRRIAHELRTYNPAADEYKGEHIHKVWAREIDALLTAAQPASGGDQC